MTDEERKKRKKVAATTAGLAFGVPTALSMLYGKNKISNALIGSGLTYGAYKAIDNDVKSNAGNNALMTGGALATGIGGLSTVGRLMGTEMLARNIDEIKKGKDELSKQLPQNFTKEELEELTPGKIRAIGMLGLIPDIGMLGAGVAAYHYAKKRKNEG